MALWILLGGALLFAVSLRVVPWLGRRGDLNPIVEGMLASAFEVPVRIGNVVSEPLSGLTVTRLESVQAFAEGRLHFKADSISVYYDPIQLIAGKLENIVLTRPEVFLNLDAPLDDVTRLPDAPPGSTESDGRILPVTAGSFIVDGGNLTLRLGGRDLPLEDLRVQVWRLGEESGQEVSLSVNALGGRVRASGILDIERKPGGPARYLIRSMEASAKGISAAALAAWGLGWDLVPPGPPSGSPPAGTFDVQCSLEGVWPEEVKVLLTTRATGLAASSGEGAAVERAAFGLRIDATVLGDLERIVFSAMSRGQASVTVDARKIAQEATADVSGEYVRIGDDGGVLSLRPSRVDLQGVGEIRVEGTVRSYAGAMPPRGALAIEIPSIDLREAVARIPRALLPPGLRAAILDAGLEGRLGAALQVHGTPDRPEATGCFEAREIVLSLPGVDIPPLAARGTFADVTVDPRSGDADIGSLLLEVDGLPAGAAATMVGAAGWSASGELGATVELVETCLPLERSSPRARLGLSWASGALEGEEGLAGATGISGMVTLEATALPAERSARIDLDATFRLDEVLLGGLYAHLAGRPVALGTRGEVRWLPSGDIEAVSLESIRAESPLTGPLVGAGSAARGPDGLEVDGTADMAAIPLGEAFSTFLRDPLLPSLPFLDGSTMDGEGSLAVRVRGPMASPGVTGRLRIGGASGSLGPIAIEDLGADIPFELGGTAGLPRFSADGALRAGRVASGPLDIRDLELPLRLKRGAYSLASSRRIEVLGGTVDISGASFSPGQAGAPIARATIRARGLDVGRITRGWGLPEVDGALEIDFHPIAITRRGRLDARGVILLEAFGGALTFADLILENLGKPYSDLQLGRGQVEGVRLMDMGRTFRFGVMSGVLRGTIRDLQVTGGDITSFEGEMETVRTPGVPQYLNKKAIESLRRILSGPFGAIEESLFSRFHFDRFGFSCRLRDGVFRLRGKYEKGGVEYLMYSHWYQFPRIDIVNGRPDMPYDWRSIVANLRAIYAGAQEEE